MSDTIKCLGCRVEVPVAEADTHDCDADTTYPRCPRCGDTCRKEGYRNGICSTCNADERKAWVTFAAAALPAYIAEAYRGDKTTFDEDDTVVPACMEADALLDEYRRRFGPKEDA